MSEQEQSALDTALAGAHRDDLAAVVRMMCEVRGCEGLVEVMLREANAQRAIIVATAKAKRRYERAKARREQLRREWREAADASNYGQADKLWVKLLRADRAEERAFKAWLESPA